MIMPPEALSLTKKHDDRGLLQLLLYLNGNVKADVQNCKTIRHLFYASSSFVHHFIAMGDFLPNALKGHTIARLLGG